MAEWYYGKEGQQYGPIDEATLRARIATGEIRGGDLIWSEGMVEWTPLSKVSQFSGPPPSQPSATPVQEYTSSDPGSPYAPPSANPVAPVAGGVQMSPPTSGLAIASMVCGILSIFLCFCGAVLGIPAVICGHMAMKQTDPNNSPRMGGRGMAIAGLIMGYLSVAMFLLGMVLNLAGVAFQ